MTLQTITIQIDIPEGFEFDRIDTKTREGDYYLDGRAATDHNLNFITPRILLRKKKPQTRWARMYKYSCGRINKVAFVDREQRVDSFKLIGGEFIEWVGDWQEYTIE